jgi:hypothetical protein
MEEYKDRVIQERHDLGIRITKLDNFIKSEAFLSIPTVDQILLIQQRVHMLSYFNILDSRCARF